ncbi:Solute carrier family 35 member F6 [Tritrichomonas foetus]|uniref:Solute carrier family 35 member F6 n=1 Tax=Tritrichomonas foetus TaxID=1144522 RepID=A0A1J4JK42_9EUKA|nr:Solute carrier family 35 member F6 [Tritrichomonas foetus]|eukprot:OHS97899.1 Solute carrier family 35 member F6 [Tritrichomonas foetus]
MDRNTSNSHRQKLVGRLGAFFLLFFGTISSVTSKVQLTIPSHGYAGIIHYFEKPGMQVFVMFFGMIFALPVGTCWGPNGPMDLKKFSLYQWVIPVLNSVCATVAIFINTVGLARINVSIFMMLRGSLSIFSTLFSIIFLRKKFYHYQWLGIVMTIISLVIVGVAGVLMSDNTKENDDRFTWVDRLFGVLIVLVAQIIQGWQLVFDEYMTQHLKLPVMLVVGMEGIWGCLIMIFIAFPFCFIIPGKDPSPFGGSLENVYDSLLMIGNSSTILAITLVSCFAIGCFDIAGMTVTATMSSVHRTIFEALRTLTTWAVMLFIGLFSSSFGEHWCNWSWLELGGFALLVCSSLIFNGVIHLPFFKY